MYIIRITFYNFILYFIMILNYITYKIINNLKNVKKGPSIIIKSGEEYTSVDPFLLN